MMMIIMATMVLIVYTKTSFSFYANRSRWHHSVKGFMIRKARYNKRRQHIEITLKNCLTNVEISIIKSLYSALSSYIYVGTNLKNLIRIKPTFLGITQLENAIAKTVPRRSWISSYFGSHVQIDQC